MNNLSSSRTGMVSLTGQIIQITAMIWPSVRVHFQPWVHDFLLQDEFALTRVGTDLHLLMPTAKGVTQLRLFQAAEHPYINLMIKNWVSPDDNHANYLAAWFAANGCLPIDPHYTFKVQALLARYRAAHTLPDRPVEIRIKSLAR